MSLSNDYFGGELIDSLRVEIDLVPIGEKKGPEGILGACVLV